MSSTVRLSLESFGGEAIFPACHSSTSFVPWGPELPLSLGGQASALWSAWGLTTGLAPLGEQWLLVRGT